MKKLLYRPLCMTIYLFLLLLNLFMLLYLGNYYSLIALAALLVLPFFSYALIKFLINRISVSISGAGIVENRNNDFKININFKNKSIFFSNNCVVTVEISNTLFKLNNIHQVVTAIQPLSTVTVTYPLNSEKPGILLINIKEIELFDLLGIFSLKKKINVIKEIPVFPDCDTIDTKIKHDFSKGYTEIEESKSKGMDTSEVSGIREYIPSDNIKDIHWKLSAKKDNLLVKERVSLSAMQLVFYIDLKNCEELTSVLDYAYGIGNYLAINNQIFTYMWYSVRNSSIKKMICSNKQDLMDCIFQILYEESFDDSLINDSIQKMSGYSDYVTIGDKYVLEDKQK